jgi:hypothetical protein
MARDREDESNQYRDRQYDEQQNNVAREARDARIYKALSEHDLGALSDELGIPSPSELPDIGEKTSDNPSKDQRSISLQEQITNLRDMVLELPLIEKRYKQEWCDKIFALNTSDPAACLAGLEKLQHEARLKVENWEELNEYNLAYGYSLLATDLWTAVHACRDYIDKYGAK